MSVVSPTFDLLFERLQRKEARIERLDANVRRRQAKIDSLKEEPASPSRDRRLARLEGVQYAVEFRRADLVEDVSFFEEVLPSDEFTPFFWKDKVTGENVGIGLTITDSPYDDTYVGGTRADFYVRGSNYLTPTGTRGFGRRSSLVGRNYAPIDDSTTVGLGFDKEAVNGDYDITLSLFNYGTNDVIYSQQLILNGEQLI